MEKSHLTSALHTQSLCLNEPAAEFYFIGVLSACPDIFQLFYKHIVHTPFAKIMLYVSVGTVQHFTFI